MFAPKLINGDLVLENGDLALVSGGEELAQCCQITLGSNRGEWWFNPEAGLDFDVLLGKGIDEEMVHDAIREALLQEERIVSVDELIVTLDRKARSSVVSFTATGRDGETIQEEVIVDAGS
jgi:hypothetical protein